LLLLVVAMRKQIKYLNSIPHKYAAIVVFIFLLLVGFAVNGSSLGAYHSFLYGNTSDDPSLLYGKPRQIRSDEWVNWSVLTVSQDKNNYQKHSDNLSTGQNLALQPEVPIADWSTVFRPHNWAFFLIPFENAFAFRWWFYLVILLIASYLYAQRHLKNTPQAILFSTIVAATPFLLWWYQVAAVGAVAYSFLLLLITENLITKGRVTSFKKPSVRVAVDSILVSYLAVSFALLFYPPFQIPLAIVLLFYCIGLSVNEILNKKVRLTSFLKRLAPGITGIAISISILFTFVIQNIDVISSLSNSVYPGERVIEGGGLRLDHLFNGFLQAILQSESRSTAYFSNQSEASNFILIAPFLIAPSIVLIVSEFIRTRKLDWPLIAVNACLLLLIARALMPFAQPLFELLLLDKVPPQRLLIGIGFSGLLQLILFIKLYGTSRPYLKKWVGILIFLWGTGAIITLAYFSYTAGIRFPAFISPDWIVIPLAGLTALTIVLLLVNRPTLALLVLAFFSVFSSFKIMPLYQGLGELTDSRLLRAMDGVSSERVTWATVDYPTYEGAGSLVGDKTVTGVNTYPDADFWVKTLGEKYKNTYNRQAHVIFTSDQSQAEEVKLITNSSYAIKLTCERLSDLQVDYILAPGSLDRNCLKEAERVSYPNVVFFIYRVN
jgi:hypothetical protein